jgi:hypothetical protein
MLALTAWVAPSSAASASRVSFTSTATTVVAPATFAAITEARPTDPVPNTASDSPGRTRSEFSTAPAPVCSPHPSGPASSNGMSSGIRTVLRSEARANRANDDWPKK